MTAAAEARMARFHCGFGAINMDDGPKASGHRLVKPRSGSEWRNHGTAPAFASLMRPRRARLSRIGTQIPIQGHTGGNAGTAGRIQMKYALTLTAASLFVLAMAQRVCAATDEDSWPRFRETYRELVETNTTLSAGDCTLAAQRMASRLRSAGYPEADLRVFIPDGHPKEVGLLAI
jgi:hypothetical protein